MRRSEAYKFSGRYDFRFLPESWKMLLIACHQIIRAGNVGTFQEHIVVRIGCHFKAPRRSHGIAVVLDELEQLQPEALANLQFRPGKYLAVFLQDRTGDSVG